MASTPEGKVKELCKKFFIKHDIPYWSVIPSVIGNSVGMSDFVAITKDGRWLTIEAKAPDKKRNVTVSQQKFISAINERQGRAFVVDSKEDLDQIEIILRHHELI